MEFYPDIKDGMSPSSFASWMGSRSAFVNSYFAGGEMIETEAMRTGTQVHRLIEGGMMKAKHDYEHAEDSLSVTLEDKRIFRGRPDSWESDDKEARFVDYKTGKENKWKEKLPTDLKMRATAFLVWAQAGKPEIVRGFIEFIQTQWNDKTRTIEPIENKESEVESIVYTAKDMKEIGGIILTQMGEVNANYLRWKNKGETLVDMGTVAEYSEIAEHIKKLTTQGDELKRIIKDQMEFGCETNLKTDFGTFYITTRETYEYPPNIKFTLDGEKEYTLEESDKIASGAKAARKNYEMSQEPVSQSTGVGFKPNRV